MVEFFIKSIEFFLKNAEFFGVAIAFIALLRPEIEKLLGFLIGKTKFYKSSALLEIGFFDNGPSIGIAGTIASEGCGHFIEKMSLQIKRKTDNASYNFSWGVFRDIDLVNSSNSRINIAYPFDLKSGASRNLNIQFHDIETREKLREPVLNFVKSYQKFLEEQNITLSSLENEKRINVRNLFEENPERHQTLLNVYTRINEEFYWKASEYSGILSIKTRRKTFNFEFNFEITREESDNLKLNSVALLETVMNIASQPTFINKSWNLTLQE